MLSGPGSLGVGLEQPILLQNRCCLLLMGTQLPGGLGRECSQALPKSQLQHLQQFAGVLYSTESDGETGALAFAWANVFLGEFVAIDLSLLSQFNLSKPVVY